MPTTAPADPPAEEADAAPAEGHRAVAPPAAGESRRRPRDRSAAIARHATELFVQNGYHVVRMEDIAAACGVTVRALYRHYPTKQALLSIVIHEDQDRLLDALRGTPEAGRNLEDVLRAFAQAAVRSPNLGILWQREARHLTAPDFAAVRRGLLEIVTTLRTAIVRARPQMNAARAELRAWATVSVLTNVGSEKDTPAQARVETLVRAALALIAAPPPALASATRPGTATERQPRPIVRREQLLWAAAKQFRHAGYGGVTLDGVGSQLGIAGPAAYRYFPSKAALLHALIARFQDWTAYQALRAQREADSDDEVLSHLVASYIQLATDATDLLAVAVAEVAHLEPGDAHRARRERDDQIEEWAHWLRTTQSHLRDDDARLLTTAARAVIEDLARTPHLTWQPQFQAELVACVRELLLGDP
jgi:AcrR family transcriptional regulator